MTAYELLYIQRRYAEEMIDKEDDATQRRHWARLAYLFHAKIERLERNYDNKG